MKLLILLQLFSFSQACEIHDKITVGFMKFENITGKYKYNFNFILIFGSDRSPSSWDLVCVYVCLW